MVDMRIIENDLVPVYETNIGQKVVYGTELHATLEVKTPYRTWIDRRLSDCEAIKDKDYTSEQICTVSGGTPKREDIIKLDTAKEIAMLERNEKGKQVRRYFIRVEEKYKQQIVDRSKLPHTMQIMYAMMDEQAKLTIKQQQQDKKIQALEQKQETIVQAFSKDTIKDFRPWVKECITSIAESPNYQFIGSRDEKYQAVRKESYDRLNHKKPCRLKQRVESEKGRALTAGASATRVNAINKLTIIENDKALKPIYETVLKEMMIAYCVDSDIKNR